MVSNDLFKPESVGVGRHVTVGDEDDVITKANGPTYGRIDAVLGHASGDHKLFDTRTAKFRVESRVEECIAGSLVNDWLIGQGCNLGSNLPSWSSRFQSVAWTSIVLHVYHWHRRGPAFLDESGDTRNSIVEGVVDFFLARQTWNVQNIALDIDDKKGCLDVSHVSTLTARGNE
jgi:hypothetical protein